MATMIDLDDIQLRSEDQDELASFLRQLIGKPFLFFRESYGEELTLHLGERIPYKNSKMSKHQRGSYLIAAKASAWIVASIGSKKRVCYTSDNVVPTKATGLVQSFELGEIEKREIVKPGSVVVNITAIPAGSTGFILDVTLSDNTTFVIVPVPRADNENDPNDDEEDGTHLPDWEIFMPGNRVLRAGPSQSWSYLNTNTKLSDMTN